MGLRSGPGWGLTPPSGNRTGVSLLYDTNGEFLSIMGYPFAALRVGATVAVSTKYLARANSRRVGLTGTGNLSLPILQGVKAVRDIREVFVYSRDAERRQKFCESAEKALGIPVTPVDDARKAVAGMDIVLTATSSRKPLFPADWLEPGMHVASMGPISEMHEDIYLKADRIIVTSIDNEDNYFVRTPPFPLVDLVQAGKLKWEDVSELGAVIEGLAPGRKADGDITAFHESQGGFGDIVLVSAAYEEAKKRGFGQEMTF
jgi:ornithine cyclodeaminase/alanine dehydrogenase-like protein (mu-crystallin family)